MIRSFADAETERIWSGRRGRRLPTDIQRTARRKLRQPNAVERLDDMTVPRGNRLEPLKGPPRLRGIASGSTTSGESASTGTTERPTMSGSRTTTKDEDWLDNVHPGEVLRQDFLIGSEIPVAEVSEGAGIPLDALNALLDARAGWRPTSICASPAISACPKASSSACRTTTISRKSAAAGAASRIASSPAPPKPGPIRTFLPRAARDLRANPVAFGGSIGHFH
ncbi:MAG: toxin HigB [Sphingomonadales bacterium]|nr:toxin HigB [Sphingomonadales bacterium]